MKVLVPGSDSELEDKAPLNTLNDDPGSTFGGKLRRGLHFFQSGLNPDDPGVKLNPVFR